MTSYREVVPHPALEPYVDRFWIRTDGNAVPAERFRVLPDGCIDILVDCTGGRSAVAVGTMTRAQVVVPHGLVQLVAVRFRPGGGVPFLRTRADALTDKSVTCVDLGIGDLIPAGLGDGEDLTSALQRLQLSLLAKLRDVATPDPRIRLAVRSLVGRCPPAIDELARTIGWSRQHLTRAMCAEAGISPKQLARTARLQRATTLLQQRPRATIAAVAVNVGYFDQAHMAGDFRKLAGVAPRDVREARGSILPIPSMYEDP